MEITCKYLNFIAANQYGGWQDYHLPHSATSTYIDMTQDNNIPPPLLTRIELILAQEPKHFFYLHSCPEILEMGLPSS